MLGLRTFASDPNHEETCIYDYIWFRSASTCRTVGTYLYTFQLSGALSTTCEYAKKAQWVIVCWTGDRRFPSAHKSRSSNSVDSPLSDPFHLVYVWSWLIHILPPHPLLALLSRDLPLRPDPKALRAMTSSYISSPCKPTPPPRHPYQGIHAVRLSGLFLPCPSYSVSFPDMYILSLVHTSPPSRTRPRSRCVDPADI